MLSFLNVAKKLNKKLAISLKQAYLLDELAKCGDSIAPKTDDDNLQLYANRKSWGARAFHTCITAKENYSTREDFRCKQATATKLACAESFARF